MDKLVPWGDIAICNGNTYSIHTRSSHRDPQSQDEIVPQLHIATPPMHPPPPEKASTSGHPLQDLEAQLVIFKHDARYLEPLCPICVAAQSDPQTMAATPQPAQLNKQRLLFLACFASFATTLAGLLFFGVVFLMTSYASLPIWARVVWALVMSANMLLEWSCCEDANEAGGH